MGLLDGFRKASKSEVAQGRFIAVDVLAKLTPTWELVCLDLGNVLLGDTKDVDKVCPHQMMALALREALDNSERHNRQLRDRIDDLAKLIP